MKQTILVGVTGGIAAFKTLEIVRFLVDGGYQVEVIATKSATRIVPPADFTNITGHQVHTDLFAKDFDYKTILENRHVDHIDLAGGASLFVIVPATANVIAKLASGIADDFLTTTALAATCPVLVAPSMNVFMWNNPVTQQNIEKIIKNGISVIEPTSGMLACGYVGKGKLADTKLLTQEIIRMAQRSTDLQGKTVLVTAGATAEPIDDVRTITNRSTGKMGVAIADAARLRGARVLLLRAKSAVTPRFLCDEYIFETPDELEKLMQAHMPHADICIHAAAVSDFQVKGRKSGKISSQSALPLELTPRTKILEKIKAWNPHVFLVGFKAESRVSQKVLTSKAQEKLKLSHADMIVANDVGRGSRGFATDTNEVVVVGQKLSHPLLIPLASKQEIAEKLMDQVIKASA